MNYKHLLIFIIIICILLLLVRISINIDTKEININIKEIKNNRLELLKSKKELPTNKPLLWFYWEDMNTKRPGYIDICIDSIYKKCSNSFNIIKLDKNNINDYLPEIIHNKMNFKDLKIAQKVDFYRILLMYKYGGIYIDVDILVLKDLKQIHDKLKLYDYVGFGCTGNKCKDGTGRPSNWILCSRPNTTLMLNILHRYYDKINKNEKITYHDLGKILIWEELDNLIKNNGYKYYHYPNLYDGTRDINGNWVSMSRLFSNENILYDRPNELLFIVLYNSDATEEIKKLTKEELLNSNYFITKYFNKSINQ
jgi:mannosyltransferase OCH1-like enzyme